MKIGGNQFWRVSVSLSDELFLSWNGHYEYVRWNMLCVLQVQDSIGVSSLQYRQEDAI